MDLDKKLMVWKIIMFFSLLILLYAILLTELDPCMKCDYNYQYEGETYEFRDFYVVYKDECLTTKSSEELTNQLNNLSFSPNK